ncbi:MAG: hypothetical protein JW909_13640 [Planctomycetes bacterium]|nr:hypothetical protein [Planctomycetota bacterium]
MSGTALLDEFRELFGAAGKEGKVHMAAAAVKHPQGQCEAVLGRSAEGWFVEARQKMGWTDFDAVKEGLIAAAARERAALLSPGPDGTSQPVLRVRVTVAGSVKEAWRRAARALAAMDEHLRLNG